MAKRGTHEEFIKMVYDMHGNEYTVLGTYVNSRTPIRMRHNVCGYDEWYPKPNGVQQGDGCPKCAGNLEGTTESFKQEVYNKTGSEYTVLGKYVKSYKPIRMKHNVCGYDEWEPTPARFNMGDRCPKCAGKLKGTTESFKQEVFDLVGDEYTVLGEYVNTSTLIRMKHNTCGYDKWEVTPHNFKSCGDRCPNCANTGKPSNTELEVLEFIKSFYTDEIKESCTDVLDNHKELDIYLPNIKKAVEFDGLYWHSDKFRGREYHLNKTLKCEEKEIQLLHIFEDEWLYKQDIVKSKLKYILGCSMNLIKIRASKCYISELNSKDKNQFLNENHIQGEDKANIKLGLWYPINDEEDRLVAVMTFCKPRSALGRKGNSKKQYDYELSRFATDIDYQVYGAFDKLFDYFKENYEWNSVITYADRRWSKGGLYENTGFKLIDISKPNYWYCKDMNRFHRYSFRKSELKKKFPELYNESSTEFEIMNKTNYTRVWDCGNYVYAYNKC